MYKYWVFGVLFTKDTDKALILNYMSFIFIYLQQQKNKGKKYTETGAILAKLSCIT